MSYIINKTDGTILTEVVDGTIDQLTTSITLIGKNSSSFGEFLNENLIHILENFSSPTAPENAIEGQLWYDNNEKRLKVYDSVSGFKVSGGTIVSNVIPSSITQGDIWIDSFRKQLYFNDGTETLLAGPLYTEQQGVSGFQAVTVKDEFNIERTILLLYSAQVLLGIFSSAEFKLAAPISGFGLDNLQIYIGFNTAQPLQSSFKYRGTASQALYLVDQNGQFKSAEDFLSINEEAVTVIGTLTIANNTPLILGASSQEQILFDGNSFVLKSTKPSQNFTVSTKDVAGNDFPAIFVNATNQYLGIFTNSPSKTLDVNGSARIRGDLLVEGATTTVNTNNLVIEDYLVQIGKVDTPTDLTADGGGISLSGATDKTLTWDRVKSSWVSSENFSLSQNSSYFIQGPSLNTKVIDIDTVYSKYAPNLLTVGNLQSLQAGNINISSNNVISFTNITIADGNIVLQPKGAGTVDVNSTRITSVATPTQAADATNKNYVDTQISLKPLGLSVVKGVLNEAQIAVILEKVYPQSERVVGTLCRVWYTDLASGGVYVIASGTPNAWQYQTAL